MISGLFYWKRNGWSEDAWGTFFFFGKMFGSIMKHPNSKPVSFVVALCGSGWAFFGFCDIEIFICSCYFPRFVVSDVQASASKLRPTCLALSSFQVESKVWLFDPVPSFFHSLTALQTGNDPILRIEWWMWCVFFQHDTTRLFAFVFLVHRISLRSWVESLPSSFLMFTSQTLRFTFSDDWVGCLVVRMWQIPWTRWLTGSLALVRWLVGWLLCCCVCVGIHPVGSNSEVMVGIFQCTGQVCDVLSWKIISFTRWKDIMMDQLSRLGHQPRAGPRKSGAKAFGWLAWKGQDQHFEAAFSWSFVVSTLLQENQSWGSFGQWYLNGTTSFRGAIQIVELELPFPYTYVRHTGPFFQAQKQKVMGMINQVGSCWKLMIERSRAWLVDLYWESEIP